MEGAKIVGKKTGKIAKKRLLCSHDCRDQKMGEKIARNNVSRNTRIVQQKNGKKSSKTSAKKRFLYSYEYRD